MNTLSIICISPRKKLFGNSVRITEAAIVNKLELPKLLNQSIAHCTKKSWPRLIIASNGPIRVI